MNNIVGETSKQVGSIIDTFKREPLMLALIIISFALVGLLYLQSIQFTTQRRENVALFVQVQKDVQNLLSRCIVPAPNPRAELEKSQERRPPFKPFVPFKDIRDELEKPQELK